MSQIRKVVELEFLYLDLTRCDRCQATDETLDEALEAARRAAAETGIDVRVRKVHVQTEEQARALGFASSPTIRVNGRDIEPNVAESACGGCSDLAGVATECRVWRWNGQDFASPPREQLLDAVLRAPAERMIPAPAEPPANLKRFFAARQQTKACCEPGCCR